MKAILMSIRPQWVAKILNGEKTIEIRKKFPKDYVGWVYIYATKGKLNLVYDQDYDDKNQTWKKGKYELADYGDKYSLNGKVVARFWCDRVKEFSVDLSSVYDIWQDIKETCLTEEEIIDYILDKDYFQGIGYAIHITKLEIFDKPKEISEFSKEEFDSFFTGQIEHYRYPLTRAPQSWCYIEV